MELLAADDPPLDLCLLLVSEALSSNPKAVDEGMAALDSLADAVTEPTVERVLNHIFGVRPVLKRLIEDISRELSDIG